MLWLGAIWSDAPPRTAAEQDATVVECDGTAVKHLRVPAAAYLAQTSGRAERRRGRRLSVMRRRRERDRTAVEHLRVLTAAHRRNLADAAEDGG